MKDIFASWDLSIHSSCIIIDDETNLLREIIEFVSIVTREILSDSSNAERIKAIKNVYFGYNNFF